MKICSKWNAESKRARRAIFAGLLLSICIVPPVHAQVAPSADRGGILLSAGGMGSAAILQYGERKMLGITGFVDLDTRRRLGIEAEGRWLEFHQTDNVHAETYSVGPRYHFDLGRFQIYGKGLVGIADFTFPQGTGTGSYFAVTAGGGLDYQLTPRIHIRAVDFEYQDWPQFTFGSFNSIVGSTGIRVRIF